MKYTNTINNHQPKYQMINYNKNLTLCNTTIHAHHTILTPMNWKTNISQFYQDCQAWIMVHMTLKSFCWKFNYVKILHREMNLLIYHTINPTSSVFLSIFFLQVPTICFSFLNFASLTNKDLTYFLPFLSQQFFYYL